jgi:hypothetical protein
MGFFFWRRLKMVSLTGVRMEIDTYGLFTENGDRGPSRLRILNPNGAGTHPSRITDCTATALEESSSRIKARQLARTPLTGSE